MCAVSPERVGARSPGIEDNIRQADVGKGVVRK